MWPSSQEKVHQSLRKLAEDVKGEYTKTPKGRKREALKSKSNKFHIFERQTISVVEVREEISFLRDEIEDWKRKHDNLDMEIKTLFEEM